MLEKGRIDGHHVFEVAVFGAILDHKDLAVPLNDLSLDLARLFVQQDFVRQLAVDDLLADLRDAFGAERVGATGPTQRRLFFLIGLQQRLIGPLGGEGGVGTDAVGSLKNEPSSLGNDGDRSFRVFYGFRHGVS
ncbi:MAG: hypothetical protein WA510_21860 [Acidobacteriaceae bacterium]